MRAPRGRRWEETTILATDSTCDEVHPSVARRLRAGCDTATSARHIDFRVDSCRRLVYTAGASQEMEIK
jgi:hypothetical protein